MPYLLRQHAAVEARSDNAVIKKRFAKSQKKKGAEAAPHPSATLCGRTKTLIREINLVIEAPS